MTDKLDTLTGITAAELKETKTLLAFQKGQSLLGRGTPEKDANYNGPLLS